MAINHLFFCALAILFNKGDVHGLHMLCECVFKCSSFNLMAESVLENSKGDGMMRTTTFGRLLLSESFILNCQIASLLAVILLLSDITDASELSYPSPVIAISTSLAFN